MVIILDLLVEMSLAITSSTFIVGEVTADTLLKHSVNYPLLSYQLITRYHHVDTMCLSLSYLEHVTTELSFFVTDKQIHVIFNCQRNTQ